jgi:hypothetical protein
VSDATFKTTATGSGSTISAPEVHVDKVKIIAVRLGPPAGSVQSDTCCKGLTLFHAIHTDGFAACRRRSTMAKGLQAPQ